MKYSTIAAHVCVAAVIGLKAIPASAQTRGYTAQPSGFDLNFNSVVGQAGTGDVNLCDGQGDSSSTTGEDLDGNGVADRQVYVDLSAGTDTASCGLPGSPCRTITFGMNGSNGSVSGGAIQAPASAQIQAICFKGVGRETVVPSQSGAPGTYVLPRTGYQTRSFKLPRYPFILSGWDANNNNQYPPYDSADTAELNGTAGGASLPQAIANTLHVSNIEYAHFTARNYGQTIDTGNNQAGFMKVVAGGGSASQIYVHDLQLTDIMRSQVNGGFHIVFDMFTSGTVLSDVAIVNLNVTNAGGGYFARGVGGPGVPVGPYRFQNVSLTVLGATDDYWGGFKLWDYVSGIEILDNNFDANPTAWSPHAVGGAGVYGIGLAQCSQNWTIRGNTFLNFRNFINVQSYASGFCETRPVDQVDIDGNILRNTYAPYEWGDVGIWVEAGNSLTATVGTVSITNNFLSSSQGWEACMRLEPGNPGGPQSGTVTVAGNTCYGPINRYAAITIGNPEGGQAAFPLQSFVIKNNIIGGTTGGAPNIITKYNVTNLVINGNAYDPQSGFSWNGSTQSLSAWRSSANGDGLSKQCSPLLVDAASGNFRLNTADACARGAGVTMTTITTWDIDRLQRSSTNPSIGASEARVSAPSPPTNLRIIR